MLPEIKEELALLESEGLLHRRAVVEKAKDKNSALNKYFIWDKSQAAERYWLETAGALIRSYKVMVKVNGSEKSVPVRAYVSLSTDRKKGGGYRTLTNVLDDDVLHDQMLADAMAELQVFQNKYSVLSEMEAVILEIEKVLEVQRTPRKQSESHAAV
jgi:hypothetical protein